MALAFDSIAEVALARDLLRRWWGLELGLADAAGSPYVRTSNTTCAMLHAAGDACDRELRAVAADLAAGKRGRSTAITRRCYAGLTIVGAPVWGGTGLAGVVYTSGMRTPSSARDPGREASPNGEAVRSSARDPGREASPNGEAVRSPSEGDVASKVATTLALAPTEAQIAAAATPELSETELVRVLDLVSAAAAAVERLQPIELAPTTFQHPFTEIVGEAPAVREVIKLLGKVVKSEATVLIHGESGTGKELIARAIHYHGPRGKKPFVVQNCSAFNDNLLESALFGHVRGAFTGAVKDQKGLFETADGGTFFLDEIGDMSSALQVKLLRVLQEGTLTPVGGTKQIKVDVRIIAASHKDLAQMVERKQFREDLFYRVNVLKLTVPPLRERAADIPRLAQFFIGKHWRNPGPAPRLTPSAIARLVAHSWPGNIRELENEIERMLVLAGDAKELTGAMVSSRLTGAAQHGTPRTLRDTVAVAETDAIVAALGRHGGDREAAASELGVSQPLLDARARSLGLDGRGSPAAVRAAEGQRGAVDVKP